MPSKWTLLYLASSWTWLLSAPQQSLIQQALDEPATIELENVRLIDVFAEVTKQTGVGVEMSPEVMALIPHGGETKLKRASIPNVPVRKGLADLVGPLGMTLEVREDRVVIVPRDALRRIGRPATWADLATLQKLARLRPGERGDDIAEVLAIIQLQVDVRGGREILASAIRDVGAGPAEEVLSIATRNLGWSWRVDGAHLVIESVERQHRAQLSRSIDLRMNSRPLFDILTAIGEAAGVPVRVDPEALRDLPINVRQSFSVNLSNRTAEQALDAVAAYTGLGYLIDPDGVLFYNPAAGASRVAQPATPASGGNPYVASMEVDLGDGRSVRWLIRASELPPELLDRRREDIDSMIRALSDSRPANP